MNFRGRNNPIKGSYLPSRNKQSDDGIYRLFFSTLMVVDDWSGMDGVHGVDCKVESSSEVVMKILAMIGHVCVFIDRIRNLAYHCGVALDDHMAC